MGILQDVFGYESFRVGQEQVIQSIMDGHDTMAIYPTGLGKSLCYEYPAYQLNQSVLVVSPLVSLMEDQVRRIKARGEKRVIALTSALTREERTVILSTLHTYRFIFVSPEILVRSVFSKVLRQLTYGLIAFDEAHCVSEWGLEFRPDYLRMGQWLNQLETRPPVLALTATANEQTTQEIITLLQLKRPQQFRQPVDRDTIYLQIEQVEEKIEAITHYVHQIQGPGILYTRTRKQAEWWGNHLLQQGIRSASYHGGMEMQDRSHIQQQFMIDQLDWICATSAFGMGIDKRNVRVVIHDHLPLTFSDYLQEIGRAGRDGEIAHAALFLDATDSNAATSFITHHLLPPELIKRFYQQKYTLEEFQSSFGYSESTYEVLQFFKQHYSLQHTLEQFTANERLRFEQLAKIKTYVSTSKCYREVLLQLNGEKLDERLNYCCNHCHTLEIKPKKTMQTVENMVNYEERLKDLLL